MYKSALNCFITLSMFEVLSETPKNIFILPIFMYLPFLNQEKLFPIETNGN